jgi:hypothetical protein
VTAARRRRLFDDVGYTSKELERRQSALLGGTLDKVEI